MIASTSAVVALLSLSGAFAAPLMSTRRSANQGALFFMTNDPSGNKLVVNSVGNDGKVSFNKTMSTGGKGQTGVGGGPDALFSQDSVLVAGPHIHVVNPGSNTVSSFSVSTNDPTNVAQVGSPVNSMGEFPMAIAANPKNHNHVCVANGGQVNGVACYLMQSNGLQPLNNTVRSLNLNQTTPPAGPAGTVSDILFSEDGKSLLVSVKGDPPTPGFVAHFGVGKDGALSNDFHSLSATAGGLPFGMSIIPGQNAIIATDPAVGASIFKLGKNHHHHKNSTSSSPMVSSSNSNSNSSSNAETTAIPISGQGAVCWSVMSKATGSFFVSDIKTSMVTEISVDKNLNAKVVKQYAQTPNSGTIDVARGSFGKNDFVYVLATNSSSPQINVLSVGSQPGQAQNIQTFDVGSALNKDNTKFTNVNLQGMAFFGDN